MDQRNKQWEKHAKNDFEGNKNCFPFHDESQKDWNGKIDNEQSEFERNCKTKC